MIPLSCQFNVPNCWPQFYNLSTIDMQRARNNSYFGDDLFSLTGFNLAFRYFTVYNEYLSKHEARYLHSALDLVRKSIVLVVRLHFTSLLFNRIHCVFLLVFVIETRIATCERGYSRKWMASEFKRNRNRAGMVWSRKSIRSIVPTLCSLCTV